MRSLAISTAGRLRRTPDFDHVKFVRRVKGQKFQVRWHLQGNVSVNLGLYDRELAVVVRREVLEHFRERCSATV